jgi:hypothetical protein
MQIQSIDDSYITWQLVFFGLQTSLKIGRILKWIIILAQEWLLLECEGIWFAMLNLGFRLLRPTFKMTCSYWNQHKNWT